MPVFIPLRVIDYMDYTNTMIFSAGKAEAIKGLPKMMKEETS